MKWMQRIRVLRRQPRDSLTHILSFSQDKSGQFMSRRNLFMQRLFFCRCAQVFSFPVFCFPCSQEENRRQRRRGNTLALFGLRRKGRGREKNTEGGNKSERKGQGKWLKVSLGSRRQSHENGFGSELENYEDKWHGHRSLERSHVLP